jgi:very-short-patch-repair endonuclease
MSRKTIIPKPEEVIKAYKTGTSAYALAKATGIDRTVLLNFLRDNGIAIRDRSQGQSNRFAKMSADERQRLNMPGRSAWKGSKHSDEALEKAARTREAHGSTISDGERLLSSLLTARGFTVRHQMAVYRYNIDLVISLGDEDREKVGVEVFGGAWHNTRDEDTRARFFLDNGWHLVYVWVQWARFPIREEAVDYIASFYKVAHRNPEPSRYSVIRGTGYELFTGTAADDALHGLRHWGRPRP